MPSGKTKQLLHLNQRLFHMACPIQLGINEWNILFLLIDANNQTGRLAIYDPNTALSAINKARRYMDLQASTALAVDDSVVLVDDNILTVV